MQTSKQPESIDHVSTDLSDAPSTAQQGSTSAAFVYILSSLLICALLSIWIMQNSVNAYYQQTYHQPSPLVDLDDYPSWSLGGTIGDELYHQHDAVKAKISAWNSDIIENFNAEYAFSPEFKTAMLEKQKQEQLKLASQAKAQAEARAQEAQLNQFSITKADQVFFAGDSLMQGVAPHVQKYLQEQYSIKTVNLSKQSTGLAYPKFFNWPQTIKETLAQNPAIKILVVFLGPNDPWDMPNPTGGAYLKFETPEWEAEYRSRIANIIQTAQRHQVKVMWISPPNMRKDSLNHQMIYLNQIIAAEVQLQHAFLIDSREILGTSNNIYNDYLLKDGVSNKMRSADGIHFSTEGQKNIAKIIEQHIRIVN
ncbi:SGNH/GDSL hydrolase family protein [Acinetobacter rudis]|uniref:DUF459 domain-containing protein n=1 Tax=Acinetobacter rudis TaxID=632955 RepID=A0AAW8JDB2_9GAMM|nr:DUF459 domain-containing protein [Acinetobacter rudis]MDQ8937091.1 DUF459 domain-containing protein [Acinetobacter rudis]MDQ9019301.1 DUF459 domain-containing protein [Acinetobacter rudis]